ncbi:MAG: hypothetical protein HYX48_00130 [Chlamydiales bacterium]|nr:hypothetical protein [Chlamydiales bacterium]
MDKLTEGSHRRQGTPFISSDSGQRSAQQHLRTALTSPRSTIASAAASPAEEEEPDAAPAPRRFSGCLEGWVPECLLDMLEPLCALVYSWFVTEPAPALSEVQIRRELGEARRVIFEAWKREIASKIHSNIADLLDDRTDLDQPFSCEVTLHLEVVLQKENPRFPQHVARIRTLTQDNYRNLESLMLALENDVLELVEQRNELVVDFKFGVMQVHEDSTIIYYSCHGAALHTRTFNSKEDYETREPDDIPPFLEGWVKPERLPAQEKA